MNNHVLITETLRLELATVESLVAMGCFHSYVESIGPVAVEVPPEAAHYDPETGLIWIKLDPQRLPRHFTCECLIAGGLEKIVSKRFRLPVKVIEQEQMLIVMSMINLVRPSKAEAREEPEFAVQTTR